MQRRRFDPEFRAGAVRIVKETGKPIARDLGINAYTLHNWVQMDRHTEEQNGSSGNGGGKLKESEQEELTRLRREKAELSRRHAEEKAAWTKDRAELEDERDVLKRSVVLWVREAMGR
ncbi:transposase [Nonomuraea sp. K274]|uniref:Transposase n=1 Tax=Nonomuraea cypriaca TaxID=1187855 RepID=A0A931AP32_9ACTN|nr:transposase [Nonomuraea cypriaca]